MGVVEKKTEMGVFFSTLIWTHRLFSLIPPQQSAVLIGFSFRLPLLLPLLTTQAKHQSDILPEVIISLKCVLLDTQ